MCFFLLYILNKRSIFILVLNMVQEVGLWMIEYKPNYNFIRKLINLVNHRLWTTQVFWQNWIFIYRPIVREEIHDFGAHGYIDLDPSPANINVNLPLLPYPSHKSYKKKKIKHRKLKKQVLHQSKLWIHQGRRWAGDNYYIVPASSDVGGLSLSITGEDCPLDVVVVDGYQGQQLIFVPVNDKKGVIRVSTDFNIYFSTCTSCPQSTLWKLKDYDYST